MSHRDSPNSPLGGGGVNDVLFGASLDALLDFENFEGGGNDDNTNPNDLSLPNNNLSGSGNNHNHTQQALLQQQPRQIGPGDLAKPLHLDNIRNDVSSCSQPSSQQPPVLPNHFAMPMFPSMSPYHGSFTPTQQQDTTGALPQQQLDQGDTTKHAAQQILQSMSLSQHAMTSLTSIAPAPSLAVAAAAAAASSSPNMSMQAPPPMRTATAASSSLANLPRFPAASTMNTHNVPSLSFHPSCLAATADSKKRPMDAASAISEDEGERQRRRQDRNLREQQRSQQITKQIAHLRQVLLASDVSFEKADKYSVLVTVGDYIKKLQEESALLDAEHGKLVETINETSKIVNEQYIATQANAMPSPMPVSSATKEVLEQQQQQQQQANLQQIPGFDYKSVFVSCPFSCSITSIDGRFIDCNQEFEDMSGYERRELLPLETQSREDAMDPAASQEQHAGTRNLSLFNVIKREDMEQVFVAMSNILKRPMESQDEPSPEDCWIGEVEFCRRLTISWRLSITLVRTHQGRPRFFNCLFLPTSPGQTSGRDLPPSEVSLPIHSS